MAQAQQEYITDFVLFISDKKDEKNINEADIEKAYVEANKSREVSGDEVSALQIFWKKVKEIIQCEIQWEKKTFAYLNSIADKCPPISRAIVGILFSILLGLLTNCIYDGITMDDYSTKTEIRILLVFITATLYYWKKTKTIIKQFILRRMAILKKSMCPEKK